MNTNAASSEFTNAIRRNQRRAIVGMVVSVFMLAALLILWLGGGLSGWLVVLGSLLIVGAVASSLFIRAWPPAPERRNGFFWQFVVFNVAYALIDGVVIGHLSIGWMIAWFAFSALWIGTLALAAARAAGRTRPGGM